MNDIRPDRSIGSLAARLSGVRTPRTCWHKLCERLVECGVPLWRVAVFVTTLHPDIMGRRFLWQADTGVTTSDALFAIIETDDYRKSPFTTVYATPQAAAPPPRRSPIVRSTSPILHDLRAEGATDYAAFPLVFTDGTIHVATWSTQAPGGFTAKQFSDLESVIAPLARVAEIRALRRTAGNLIDTYVGHQTGERICPARSAAATSKRSAPRSGCRTCAALPRCPSNCRRRR